MENKFKKIGLPIIVLLVGFLSFKLLGSLKGKPQSEGLKEKIFLVDYDRVNSSKERFEIKSNGFISPKYRVNLTAKVGGEIIYLSEKFEKGGFFKKGEIIAKVDPSDYRLRLSSAEVAVENGKLNLLLEEKNGRIAKDEWSSFSKENPNLKADKLTLREPQLAVAKANLKSAEAQLQLAKLNLDRTIIRAPYNCFIGKRDLSLGQFISPGIAIGSIYSEELSITTSLKKDQLKWVDKDSSEVIISAGDIKLNGEISSISRQIETGSRMVDIVIELDDSSNLLYNQYCDITIYSKDMEDLYAISRYLIDGNNMVKIVMDGISSSKKVDLIRSDGDLAYVRGLEDGDMVITTKMDNLFDGTKVKINN